MPQLAAPPGGVSEQVPTLCPAPRLHTPVQQSPFWEQTSPAWPHHDDGWQVPPAQRLEQQSPGPWHALPSVAQVALSGIHVPPAQVWLQH
jgi:hypothetical protein